MSAYISLAVPMTDQECLLQALVDLGFGPEKVEIHNEAVPLVGYEGADREQRAHLVIRKNVVGQASNDIGFERTATGFRVHISSYDSARYGRSWLNQLDQRYRHHEQRKFERLAEEERRRREEERRRLVEAQRQAVREKARKLGYRVQETRQGDAVRLVLLKRVY